MWFDYFFPYRKASLEGFRAWASWGLVFANLSFFLWETALTKRGLLPLLLQDYALLPDRFLHNAFELWPTLITHTFLHGDWLHLIGNLYYLWVFGPPLERRTGSIGFIFFYLGWGILGALTQVAFNTDSSTPLLGASGAIAGVLGATFVLRPLLNLQVVLPAFGSCKPWAIKIPNFVFLGFWFLLQMVRGIGSLRDTTEELQSVAYWAHAGGFTAGALGIYLWLLTDGNQKKPT